MDILKKALEETRQEFAAGGNHDTDLIATFIEQLLVNIEFIEAQAAGEE